MQLSLKYVLLLAFALGLQNAHAQKTSHWIKAGTNAPFQYSLQYELGFSDKLFVSVESGIFAEAYKPILFRSLDRQSEGTITTALVKSIFQSANMHTLQAGWNFGKFQIAVFGQQGRIKGSGKPVDLIGTYYDVSPESLPYLSINVRTYQAGLNIGYRLPISNRFALHTSVGVSRTVGVKADMSTIINGTESIGGLNDIIEQQLQESIRNYGYVPTLNIHFAYKLFANRHQSTLLSKK